MSKLSPKLHEEDILSSLEMSSVQAGEHMHCKCGCMSTIKDGQRYTTSNSSANSSYHERFVNGSEHGEFSLNSIEVSESEMNSIFYPIGKF